MDKYNPYDDVFEDDDNAQTIIIKALYSSTNFFKILKEVLDIDTIEIDDVVNHILKSDLDTLENILSKMNK